VADTKTGRSGQTSLQVEDFSPDPESLREYMTITAAGLVAELLHDRWAGFGRRWLTTDEVSHLLQTFPEAVEQFGYPSPFSSIFTGGTCAHLANQDLPEGTDTSIIAKGSFLLCRGVLLPRQIPLSQEWEETQQSPAFHEEIRNAERRAMCPFEANNL